MKKIIIGAVIVAILFASFYAYKEYQRKAPDTSSLNADFKLSANDLFNAFENDEAAANEKYTDKVIEVSGMIDAIENEDSIVNIILLADNAMIGGINCQINPNQDISTLEIGQAVTIKGICQGFLMNVILNRAIIIENE